MYLIKIGISSHPLLRSLPWLTTRSAAAEDDPPASEGSKNLRQRGRGQDRTRALSMIWKNHGISRSLLAMFSHVSFVCNMLRVLINLAIRRFLATLYKQVIVELFSDIFWRWILVYHPQSSWITKIMFLDRDVQQIDVDSHDDHMLGLVVLLPDVLAYVLFVSTREPRDYHHPGTWHSPDEALLKYHWSRIYGKQSMVGFVNIWRFPKMGLPPNHYF